MVKKDDVVGIVLTDGIVSKILFKVLRVTKEGHTETIKAVTGNVTEKGEGVRLNFLF